MRRSKSVRLTAETWMIAVFWKRGCLRIIAASSKPSTSGMQTSISTTATSVFRSCCRASSPELARIRFSPRSSSIAS